MNNAIVLGGEGHYGQWRNNRPKELDIFFNFEYDRTQIKDKHISKLDIKTVPINDMLLEKNWDRGEE